MTPLGVPACHGPMSFREAVGESLPAGAEGNGPMSFRYALVGLPAVRLCRYIQPALCYGGVCSGGELPSPWKVSRWPIEGRESESQPQMSQELSFWERTAVWAKGADELEEEPFRICVRTEEEKWELWNLAMQELKVCWLYIVRVCIVCLSGCSTQDDGCMAIGSIAMVECCILYYVHNMLHAWYY